MNKELEKLLDLAAIEEIIYAECSRVQDILGPRITDKGILIQAFIPDAISVDLLIDGQKTTKKMEKVDESGFFATLVKRKNLFNYSFLIKYENDYIKTIRDPYSFDSLYSADDIHYFVNGVHYEIFELMGAHKRTINNVDGVHFSVFAPAALKVSVVGNFNNWDGRIHQMKKLGACGIYEIFIPDLNELEIYKFEIKTVKGELILKSDPYAFYSELRPNTASIVYDINKYKFNDDAWMKKREKVNELKQYGIESPLNIYEVHLGSWLQKEYEYDENGKIITGTNFLNYRDIAKKLCKYVKSMAYTHIELLPIMEHPLDQSWGYQVTGYFSPTSRFGTPSDFMYFIDYMHQNDIGVILDWVPAHFPKDAHGLANFDGSQVYEHKDPRQGMHPHWGTLIYNYGRKEVSNFLIANALFYAKYYHIDGIRMDAIASMLYLDYGKNYGEWVANYYGGKENLDAIEFLKHLNSIYKEKYPSSILIAEESTSFPKISAPLNEGGLGFDFKWNMGFMNDFLRYMSYDPIFRSYHYQELSFSMVYHYSENFILVLSHDEVVHGKSSLLSKMPGATWEDKFANLRAAFGFMMTHPGKKLLFMGGEFGQGIEWNENTSLEWQLLDYDIHKKMQTFTKDLNKLYLKNKELWELDSNPKGFSWIDVESYSENIYAYQRNSNNEERSIFVVNNFTPLEYRNFTFAFEKNCKIKLILNSDALKYGGNNFTNPKKTIKTKNIPYKNKDYSLGIDIPAMSCLIFELTYL